MKSFGPLVQCLGHNFAYMWGGGSLSTTSWAAMPGPLQSSGADDPTSRIMPEDLAAELVTLNLRGICTSTKAESLDSLGPGTQQGGRRATSFGWAAFSHKPWTILSEIAGGFRVFPLAIEAQLPIQQVPGFEVVSYRQLPNSP